MIKRLSLLLLLVLMATTGFAQETGDVMYVYHKDGDINTFLRHKITEFYYSFEDEEGVVHDEPVLQCIVMNDSLCKLPLANIDSISFITPSTIYQPDVIRMEENLFSYVEKCDSLTLTFASNIPASLLPKVGDKLLSEETGDNLPFGFMGRVKKVSGTTVECDAVSFSDIFKRYYHVSDIKVVSKASESPGPQGVKSVTATVNLPEYQFNATEDIAAKVMPNSDLALKGTIESGYTLKPSVTVKGSIIIDEKFGPCFDFDIRSDFDAIEKYGLYGGLEYKSDFLKPSKDNDICSVAPGVKLYWKPGAYIQAALMASVKTTLKQHFFVERSFHASLKKGVRDNTVARITSMNYDIEGCLDGTAGIGLFVELGLSFLASDLDKICARGELGLELNSHMVLFNKDIAEAKKETKVYEALKASSISCSTVLNFLAIADAPLLMYTHHFPISHSWPWFKRDLVPTFSDVEFEQSYTPRTSAETAMSMTGNCILPVTVGFKILDKNGTEVKTNYSTEKYQKDGRRWYALVENLEDEKDYNLYPLVKVLGFDFLANPITPIKKKPFPVRILDFKQTGSHYSNLRDFEYEGIHYFYKYDATTTVQLSEKAYNVKDWGYIYHDIYGVDHKISCANLGGLYYHDKSKSYYNDNPSRSVVLSPYVQFDGEEEIQVGSLKTYQMEYDLYSNGSCPDNNHPHAIDLGLPSGTLWACCNVGANHPEEEGGHYMWADTKPVSRSFYQMTKNEDFEDHWHDDGSATVNNKIVDFDEYWKWIKNTTKYEWIEPPIENYPYYNPGTQKVDYIYYDIGGTRYDVATQSWGGAWRIPSYAQLDELIKYCTIDWIGNNLYRFRGMNGKTIILPNTHSVEHYYEKETKDMTPIIPGMMHGLRNLSDDYYYKARYRSSEMKRGFGGGIEIYCNEYNDIINYVDHRNEAKTGYNPTPSAGAHSPQTIRPVMIKR